MLINHHRSANRSLTDYNILDKIIQNILKNHQWESPGIVLATENVYKVCVTTTMQEFLHEVSIPFYPATKVYKVCNNAKESNGLSSFHGISELTEALKKFLTAGDEKNLQLVIAGSEKYSFQNLFVEGASGK